jgi:sugar lactone lactonase YvrE
MIVGSCNVMAQEVSYSDTSKQIQPTLFADLGETCSTPDGMAMDQKGNLFLAITNLSSFEKYGSKILTFNENNEPITWFDKLPIHPKTNRVHPMGIEFGPDGNLYIADNQNFAGEKNQSRILRIVVKDGKPIKGEVLVEGLGFANGIRIHNNKVYVTDFMFENEIESGIYCFPIDDLNKNKITLDEQTKIDYLISTFSVGIDGIAFDSNGNLYAGHFLTGTITKFEFSEDGQVKSKKTVFDSDQLNCADGMFYDKERNSIFIANLSNNSVHQLDLNTNIIHLIWVNDNSDGSEGLLDNPCETIVYKGNLIVVNFDTFQGEKNIEVDELNTISKFELEKL